MTHASTVTEAVRIVGGVGTGKTEHLVERAAQLAAAEGAESVAVFCATPSAARAFAERLRERMGEAAEGVRATTPRAFALEVLANEESRALTGRDARLLTAVEEKFLLEDLKVSGLRPKRLREMLKFFYRSWTELADDDPDWLLPGEEATLHGLLKDNLGFMRAVIEPEAANLALNCLRESEAVRTAHRFAHVLVDDYQCLSRASQLLAELAAEKSVAVASDPAACVETFDSYPYAAGLDEFAERHPDAQLVELGACRRGRATARAAANVLADPVFEGRVLPAFDEAEEGALDVLACSDPAAEFERAAAYAAEAVEAGTPAARVAVAVPNDVWARNVSATLKARGLRAKTLPSRQPIGGDARDLERCVPARVLTALNLVADPDDATAWRCWCGFGDYLLNSAAFASLREQGLPLVEALAAADGGDAPHAVGMQRVADARRAGLELISQAQGLAGRALLDALARAVSGSPDASAPGAVAALCLADGEADDASSMAQRARKRLTMPALSGGDAVAVVPYDLMAGLSPDVLVVAGFVNGFIPCRDYFDATVMPLDKQEKTHAADARRVYALVGKANRALALSHFASTDLESASVLKLKIDRIKLRDGVRVCTIAPSDFLATIVGEA
ncbi:MAG TPA: AAA family ATPase [Candidatus Rubneribacter avistercoris]|nr:AAA family ATPase [Candidatus Rubneribacter avistercoris]